MSSRHPQDPDPGDDDVEGNPGVKDPDGLSRSVVSDTVFSMFYVFPFFIITICLGCFFVALAVVAIVISPAVLLALLFPALVAVRLNQLIWVIICALLSIVASYTPKLKHAVVAGLPWTDWIKLNYTVCCGCVLYHIASMYVLVFLPRIQLEYRESGISFTDSIAEIVDCAVVWQALVLALRLVPNLKQHQTLGLQTSKWFVTAIFALMGYNAITVFTCAVVCLLQLACRYLDPEAKRAITKYVPSTEKLLHRRHVVYYANGTRRSFNFILTSTMLLLIWLYYFGSHLDTNTAKARSVLRFGNHTLISLVVCSLLWLLKTCVALAWEDHTVYTRLDSKILDLGKQAHFLRLLGRQNCDHPSHKIRRQDHHGRASRRGLFEALSAEMTNNLLIPVLDLDFEKHDQWCSLSNDRNNNIMRLPAMRHSLMWKRFCTKIGFTKTSLQLQDDFCFSKSWDPTIYDVQQVAQYLLTAEQALLNDEYDSHITKLPRSSDPRDPSNNRVTIKDLQNLVNKENNPSGVDHDWECLRNLVESMKVDRDSNSNQGDSSERICYEKLQAWMKKTREDGLLLINTISGSLEMVNCLDNIMRVVIIGATLIMWLLLTKMATTKVLLLIASPLLAASFVFGDTCKGLFQAIIFVYVLQPFSVGDECDIGEDKEMRVISIGVWKTIFSKTDDQGKIVQVVYPNSELSKLKVINHKTNLGGQSQRTTADANLGTPRISRSRSFATSSSYCSAGSDIIT